MTCRAGTLIGRSIFLCCWMVSCSPPADRKVTYAAPAKVENRIAEADLARIHLSPQAESRLGIEVTPAVEAEVSDVKELAGELMVIPGKALMVSAPVAGALSWQRSGLAAGALVRKDELLFRITPLVGAQADQRTTYEAEVASAKARLDAATQQRERASQLLRDLAGSQKNLEAAEQEFRQAEAAYEAALQKLRRLTSHPLQADVDLPIEAPQSGVVRQLLAADQQLVAGGAPLVEIADVSRLWLRVPAYVAEVDSFSQVQSVQVRDLNGRGRIYQGRKIDAPPTADPLALTADLYFEIANPDLQLRPGQRMTAILPSRSSVGKAIAVPASAIVYDIHGNSWVYLKTAEGVYRRQRVEIVRMNGGRALIKRGLSAGVAVVSTGAAELFGTEFGAGK